MLIDSGPQKEHGNGRSLCCQGDGDTGQGGAGGTGLTAGVSSRAREGPARRPEPDAPPVTLTFSLEKTHHRGHCVQELNTLPVMCPNLRATWTWTSERQIGNEEAGEN
ncbi:hypothetical protein AAFF_G00166670 [Aldrovandia affinis]|uniref:Uncharacterized protein n=1 Tax=Aldrovandia affinis TaxID=143900 RepID=A0AAD7RMC4_9TELE|nr:hypothetical protein AAFF_G00166670 [Aldrovandia affinis]